MKFTEGLERRLSVRGRDDAKALTLEIGLDERHDFGVIVDDEDRRRHVETHRRGEI